MLVSELAKEFNTTTANVLSKLKTLRLKATSGDQELSKAVVTVLRSELVKELKTATAARVAAKTAKTGAKSLASKMLEKTAEKAADKDEEVSAKGKKEATKKRAGKKGAAADEAVEKTDEPVVAKEPAPVEVKEEKPIVKAKVEPAPAPVAKPHILPPSTAIQIPKISAEALNAALKAQKVAQAQDEAKGFVPLKPLIKKKRRTPGRGDGPAAPGMPTDKTALDALFASGGSTATASGPAVPEAPREMKDLEVQLPISVKDFAVRIQEKTSMVLKKLMEMGVLANLNQNLSEDVVRKLAEAF
ncbi:MAG: translation initiation factor IF-2 N-terminal domain-containing protein, partial [Candidatus Omnitrophica bacterium]|nr:translation initiation factor IF-2 N-terminal domain-containing protein [Candidatus Omnitrophota bacterium]